MSGAISNLIRISISITEKPDTKKCGICWDPLFRKGSEVLSHDQNLDKGHPAHKSCLSLWAEKTFPVFHCPTCRVSLDDSSLLSPTKKGIRWLQKNGLPLILGTMGIAYLAAAISTPILLSNSGLCGESPSVVCFA